MGLAANDSSTKFYMLCFDDFQQSLDDSDDCGSIENLCLDTGPAPILAPDPPLVVSSDPASASDSTEFTYWDDSVGTGPPRQGLAMTFSDETSASNAPGHRLEVKSYEGSNSILATTSQSNEKGDRKEGTNRMCHTTGAYLNHVNLPFIGVKSRVQLESRLLLTAAKPCDDTNSSGARLSLSATGTFPGHNKRLLVGIALIIF